MHEWGFRNTCNNNNDDDDIDCYKKIIIDNLISLSEKFTEGRILISRPGNT